MFGFRLIGLALLGLTAFGLTTACDPPLAEESDQQQALAPDQIETADPRLDWWREARFGMFLHWGLYSVPAGEWQGNHGHAEWIRTTAQIPVEVYDGFVDQFNPVDFDADAWVTAAKDAGMKYVVITTKHHDGFALFDSAVSDFDVMATPFKRDIMKEMADACRRHGLKICWYHSIMDWHHPDYLPRRGWEAATRTAEGADFDRFVSYLRAQVTELLSNYGPIGVMWFDGEWESTWNHAYGQALYDLCRELQPEVIVNNRVDKGRRGMAGMTDGPHYAGDFGTPEQEIPATGLPGTDWETCMTMNDHWGYNRADHHYKSTTDLIRKLCDIASKGGNFLLNVGPTPQGTFPEESLQRLHEIGDWMRVNGEAIHGTTASPFAALPFGRCTVRREGATSKLYLHVFDWPQSGSLTLPGLGNPSIRARLLADPSRPLVLERQDSDLVIGGLPDHAPDPHASVIELTVEGAPLVYRPPTLAMASPVFVDSALVRIEAGAPELEIHYTLDGSEPTRADARYTKAFEIRDSATLKARCFHDGRAVSRALAVQLQRVEPWPAQESGPLDPGLKVEVYAGDWNQLPDFGSLQATEQHVVKELRPPSGPAGEYQGRRYQGVINIPTTTLYRWSLTCDDGGRLWIDDRLAIDHDGLHSASTRTADLGLAAGPHLIRVEWFNKTGGAELQVGARDLTTDQAVALEFFHRR